VQQRGSGFLVNLDHEQRARYYEWWRKYLFLKRLSWIAGAFLLACVLTARWLSPVQDFARVLAKFIVLAFIALGIWPSFLDCPRCGQTFRGWDTEKYFGDECQNCGLTGRELSSIAKPQE
jgi:hypothetical protein